MYTYSNDLELMIQENIKIFVKCNPKHVLPLDPPALDF
jgi:hypothetical protein